MASQGAYNFSLSDAEAIAASNHTAPVGNLPGIDKTKYSNWNGDWRGYLEYMADNGDAGSLDKLINVLSEDEARQWTADREDTQYQRLVEDLRKAGINPYILMQSGASPISSSTSGQSGSQISSYEINKEKNSQNWLKAFLSIIPIAIAAIATIAAL